MVLVAGGAIGLGGALALPGCETVGGFVATAVHVCVPIIRSLLNLPLPELPAGYTSCGDPTVWTEHGHSLTFCFYCSPTDPRRVYVQMNCQGDYYPLSVRPIGSPSSIGVDEGVHLEKLGCEEQLLMRARASYDEWTGHAAASFDCPNARVFPDASGYASLVVAVDGRRVEVASDFKVDFGQAVTIEGKLDEVAHYAMISGLRELSFRSGGVSYAVVVNPEVSAMMLFKDGACIDSRLLFAPVQ
jgi:hypothetical protein